MSELTQGDSPLLCHARFPHCINCHWPLFGQHHHRGTLANWLKEATSPRDAPCDLIPEKRQSPEDRTHLRNPVRWNLCQWRVACKNTHPTCHGKTVVTHNHGVPGHGRFQTVHEDSYFGGNHIKAIFQDMVSAAGTEMGVESYWIDGAEIDLMLPNEWMSRDAVCQESEPNQRLLGHVQAEERRQRRNEEEPIPQRLRTS